MSLFEELDGKIVETKDNLNNLVDRLNRFGDLDETFQKTSADLNVSIENLSSSNKTFQELSEALQNAVKSLEEASKTLVASEPSKMFPKLYFSVFLHTHFDWYRPCIQRCLDRIKMPSGFDISMQ